MECVEKLIKKDWINPLDNSKLTQSDIIPLQRVSKINNILYNIEKINIYIIKKYIHICHFSGWYWLRVC